MSTLRGTGSASPDFVGLTVGKWRILRRLGEGSFGVVYEAHNVGITARRAAVKILHPQMSTNLDLKKRFLNEANAASAAEHEHIVQIFDGGITEDGYCYSAMELLKGRTLAAAIAESAFDVRRALHIGLQVADALQAAHDIGIVHRDLKPDNVFLVGRPNNPDFVKVLDFGVAKLRGEANEHPSTYVGMLIGTPAYMSPEQWMTLPDVDGRSDIYALGVILFECLSAEIPFNETTPYAWQQAHLHGRVPDLMAKTAVPREVAEVVNHMLAKRREERPQTMLEVLHELESVRGMISLPPRPAGTPGFESTPRPFALAADEPVSAEAPTPLETSATPVERPSEGAGDPDLETDILPTHGSRGLVIAGLLAGVVAVGAGIAWSALHERKASLVPEPTPAAVVAAAPASPPSIPDELVVLGPGDLLLGQGGATAPTPLVDGPAHRVSIDRFAIGRYEVSMGEFRPFAEAIHVAGELPWEGVDNFESIRELPVNEVTQATASRYCAWKYPRFGGRLPTEEEWEYAARDGKSERRFPWTGDRFDHTRANAAPRRLLTELVAVDAMPAGATDRGIQHMIGNVAEWTSSPAALYPGSTAKTIAKGVVVRGGSAKTMNTDELTATARKFYDPETRDPFIGFRCAVGLK